ncbi:hypothetical protein EW145_g8086, partial [Phellinidium pouzarii]
MSPACTLSRALTTPARRLAPLSSSSLIANRTSALRTYSHRAIRPTQHIHLRAMSSSTAQITGKKYEHILASATSPGVLLITLNRPKALNALCAALMSEVNEVLDAAQQDDAIGAVVITGNERAFAGEPLSLCLCARAASSRIRIRGHLSEAGADIKEMKDKEFHDVYTNNFLENWHRLADFRKPTIAAVSGYALGGGCELALMCDI